jgi:triosephosphate isomerase
VRKPFIVGNWKMNKTSSEASVFIGQILERLPHPLQCELVVAPPFTALESVRGALGSSSPIGISAQNLHWESQGAFTGEISALMLRDIGCRYVIVGHSERRTLFGERNEDVRKKVIAALAHGLFPILCVGESLAERNGGQTDEIITDQLKEALTGRSEQELARLTIAYEPVWAIGTGRAATVDQVVAVHRSIRRFIEATWNKTVAASMRILYGGSVTTQNIDSLLASTDIDGALVGGACLNPDSFATIAHAGHKKGS